MNGKNLVFLDSAASSQMPQRVMDAFNDYYRCRHANIHRGAYRLSYEATDLYEESRRRVANFLKVSDEECCIFTRNATEGLNLVAHTWGEYFLEEGDEIVLSELEHHSNLIPWFMLAKRKKLVLRHVPITPLGHYDYEKLSSLMNARTRIVALQHQSNVLGTIHDIKKIAELVHQYQAILIVDGAQAAPHLPLDLPKLDCDFYSFSAHKMLGPTGVGVLYGKKELMESLPPFLGGGDMILSVSKDGFEPAALPRRFEAGTPNIVGVVMFALALDYLEKIGMAKIHAHEVALKNYALEKLKTIEGIELYGPGIEDNMRGGIISFNIKGIHSHDLATVLDNDGIAIRAGHHCCEPWMRSQNISSTARISVYLYNGPEDIDYAVQSLEKVRSIFKI